MASPSMQFRLPPGWFFKFPPDHEPPALPPPTRSRTFAAPFGIPTDLYQGALDHKVPLTVAALYATTVILWNRINRRRGFTPYAFSKTSAFKAFVIAHNVFLAIFSAFTFFGMLRGLAHTWPGREHLLLGKFWPGLRTANGLAGAADALCKMHGPRGFGQFVAYDPTSSAWIAQDKLITLGANGLPDDRDVGRLWNEGLAFWGWWFYLSKFYEVFDTFIILAKGKRSSTLQTYHHTGAMMCMWAGIRYMSPPIWMFCFLNSGIHTLMYIYYTLSALSVKVPQRVKRTLTTCQILQFLIGITFASMHLFVTYTVPLSKSQAIQRSLASMAASAAGGNANAGVASWLKQAALRASGEEGLAENVLKIPVLPGLHTDTASQRRYSEWETVPCINTSGQAFAVWLNLLYLAPLTGLFVRFFVKSYMRRGLGSRSQPTKGRAIKAAEDAAKGTERELNGVGKKAEESLDETAKQMNGNGKIPNGNGKAHSNGSVTPRSRKVSDSINKQWERFEKGPDDVVASLPEVLAPGQARMTLRRQTSEGHERLRSLFEGGAVGDRSKSPEVERGRSLEEQSFEEEQTQDKKGDLEQSWADVAKDAYPKQDVPSQVQHNEQITSGAEQQPEQSQYTEDDDRSSTPTTLQPARSLSPQKSKLPRPKSRDPPRSQSPLKPAPKKSSSIPRLSNGTKPPPSSSSSQQQTAPFLSSSSRSSSAQSRSGEVLKSALPLSPKAPNRAAAAASETRERREAEGEREGEEEELKKSDTNDVIEQDSADSKTPALDSRGEEVEAGKGAERLRWRHVSGEEGGEAERREGVSFAEAVKEGEGDISID